MITPENQRPRRTEGGTGKPLVLAAVLSCWGRVEGGGGGCTQDHVLPTEGELSRQIAQPGESEK